MKKFILKLFVIIIITYITVFLYIEFFSIRYNNINNTRWQVTSNILSKSLDISDTTINSLFLGESRVNAGIDLMKIPNSWSYATGGCTPIEIYYMLNKHITNYSTPDTVFLSISPRFLSEKLAFWHYAVRNDFFSYSEFHEILTNHKKFEKDTLLACCPVVKFVLYKSNYIGYYQSDLFKNRVFFGRTNNKLMISWILEHNGQRFHQNLKEQSSDLNYETKYNSFIPSELLDSYFNEICKLCRENNIFLIFDFMPMNESSQQKLNPIFINEYKNYIQTYQKKYIEFSISDTLIFYEDIYFGDQSHLNTKGQKKYTEYLKDKYF